MIATSSRLSFLALAVFISSALAAVPYAPELSARTVAASRPIAESVYARSEFDPIQIKRSTNSWSALNILGQRSEEEMHARGQIADSIIEKRGKCWMDSACASDEYCSTKSNKCYKQLATGDHCTRNKVCDSQYCSLSSHKCREKRSVGSVCKGNNGACASGYCSVKTDLCRTQTGEGSSCLVDAGCEWPYKCNSSKKCEKSSGGSTTPTGPSAPGPSSPAASGSPSRKRQLVQL